MSDAHDDPRNRVLDAFLGLIAERGYDGVSLHDVGEAAGIGRADLYRLFPDKLALVGGFMARIDGEVLAGTPEAIDPDETVRDRLFDMLMRRFDALKPHRAALAAVRRAGMRDPLMALVLGPALMRSMAAMLEAAGVPSRGVVGAVRQNALAAIYAAVSRVFDKDDSADLSKTMSALDSRLKTAERWAQTFGKYTDSRSRRAETAPAP